MGVVLAGQRILARKGATLDAKVQRRIYPELRIKHTHALAWILGPVLAIIGVGLLIGNILISVRDPELMRLIFGFVGLAMIYGGLVTAGLDPVEWFFALIHRRTWQRLQITTDGEIVDRNVKRRVDDEGQAAYTYWATFRFDTPEGPVVLRGQVDKPQHDRLAGVQTVQVRYALDNPRLALMEGEWTE
jgi:hypothetical protein